MDCEEVQAVMLAQEGLRAMPLIVSLLSGEDVFAGYLGIPLQYLQ